MIGMVDTVSAILSGPARALGIEIELVKPNKEETPSGPARALGIEILVILSAISRIKVGACEGPGD